MSQPAHALAQTKPSRLRDVTRATETFADLCEAAEEAIKSDDPEELFQLAFAARQLRHAISTNGDIASSDIASDAPDLILRSRQAIERARAGDELLRNLHDRELPSDEHLLADALGVISLTEAFLPTSWNFNEDMVILFGNGLDAPAEILARIGQARVCVYLEEGCSAEHYGESVLVLHSVEDLYNTIKQWMPRAPKRVVSRSLADCDTSPEEQREILEAVELHLGYIRVDRTTTDFFANFWIGQGIENLPSIVSSPSVACFREDFVGKPMVIVAPGPSLKKNIEELHKFKGKAIICTFSHTLSAFAAAGLVPDIVVTVDSQPVQYHFADFPIEKVAAMITGVTACPDLYKLPAPMHITLGANAGFDKWVADLLGEELLAPAGGSVATTAMVIGLQWKCDPIIFAGLDLSFSGGKVYVDTSCDGDLTVTTSADGKTLSLDGWSDGCHEMRKSKKRNFNPNDDVQRSFELPALGGGMVTTSQMFWLFHDWFEKKVSSLGEGHHILNCTEGGAYIEGMEHITLAEAYERFVADTETFSVSQTLTDRANRLPPERRPNAVAAVADITASLERCLSLVGRCNTLIARLQSTGEGGDLLDRVEADLISTLKNCRFISVLNMAEIDLAYNRASAAQEMEEVLQASQALYTAVRETVLEVLPQLRRALAELTDSK